jgi:putative transposase
MTRNNTVSEEWELLRGNHFTTREQARHMVAAWIDEYNNDRPSTNGMLSPVDYEFASATRRATEQDTEPHHDGRAA